ncbi:MAG TPA: ADP-ribosylglycohydrolase family protein [Dehalococcoidia bacterium]|nr:ADP-ribosylglycohydrolase family protein [Dehalococcoidia bacterium]
MDQRERYTGSLLGLAVGDALGTTLEFRAPGTFEPIGGIVGGGPFRLAPGQWTDDTSMALCLAESLAECGFDPLDQMRRYVRWWREGYLSATGTCFDIGNTTRAALSHFERTGEPIAGPTDERSAGNGSLMRLAPVALYFHPDSDRVAHFCGESSRTTHGALEAVDACRLYGVMIAAALDGRSKDDLLRLAESVAERLRLSQAVREVAGGSFRRKAPPEIRGSGYVVDSLEAVLWAFFSTDSFEEGALKAVNLGDDADTTGAIFGQLAGAFYGQSGIPAAWLEVLAMRPYIEELAERLMRGPGS